MSYNDDDNMPELRAEFQLAREAYERWARIEDRLTRSERAEKEAAYQRMRKASDALAKRAAEFRRG